MSDKTNENENKIRRYTHTPLAIEHYGITASIQANGRIIITKHVSSSDEVDEVEIPASLVFKLASLLKATRKVEYVNVAEK